MPSQRARPRFAATKSALRCRSRIVPDCGEFEGTIPKGEYGGGTVILCDRGRWKPIGDAHKGFAKAHLEFMLNGEMVRGRWHLVRTAVKPREKRQSWLLIKGEDKAASAGDSPNILEG